MSRKFTESGLGQQRLFDTITVEFPWIVAEYKAKTGNELTPHIVFMRGHNQVYARGEGRGYATLSTEHYTRSPKLRPCVEAVEAYFRKHATCDVETARLLGALPGDSAAAEIFS